MNTIRVNVLILSSQVMFRTGMELVLNTVENIQVIGSTDFSNGVQFSLDELPPDVVILDIDSTSEAGIEIAQNIKRRLPNIGVIVFTSSPNDDQLIQALKAQAGAYLSKESTSDEIIHAVKLVAHGEYPINEIIQTQPKVAERILEQFQELSWRSEAEALLSPLTPRETEILQYIARGYLNKQIAAEFAISEQTIKNHVTSILRKLNANARTEAVVVALRRGIISLD